MKHFFTLMALVAGLNSVVTAQISITASDMPTVGEAYTYESADSASMVGFDLTAGINKTWDFSSLTPSTLFDPTIEQWIEVADSPFGSEYPTATIASISGTEDSTDAMFFALDGTTFRNLGIGSVDGNSFYASGLTLVQLPMTFNSTFGSISDVETTFDGTPVTGDAANTVVVDGWGTVKTTLGTFQALRVKHDVSYQFSLFGIPATATESYVDFWAKEYGRPVFSYVSSTSNFLGEIFTDTYGVWISEATVSTKAPAPAVQQFSMAPNPATDRTYIDVATKGAHQVKVCIFATTGQLMSTTNVNASNDVQQIPVDIAAFPTGTYTVVLLGSNGKVWGSQQLVKR